MGDTANPRFPPAVLRSPATLRSSATGPTPYGPGDGGQAAPLYGTARSHAIPATNGFGVMTLLFGLAGVALVLAQLHKV